MPRVLVTGADGFIGSHLCEELLSAGYSVRALSLYNSFNDWGWLEALENLDSIEVVCGDIRDPAFCQKVTNNIDIVFHLAALIAIPFSYEAPSSYVATNINGTLNMCQAALDNSVSKFIQTSTSEVYGTALYTPIDEKHPLQPQSPYSATKIGSDAIAKSFQLSFELPVVIARPFNTYGPRQSARAVIPTIISQLAAGKSKISLGDTRPTRDFNFVRDTTRALLELSSEEKAIGKTVNIGSSKEISIGDLFKLLCDIMNKSACIEEDTKRLRPKNSEVNRLLADSSLLQQLTGYKPKFPLREGLEKTAAWFQNPENLKKYKTNTYNV